MLSQERTLSSEIDEPKVPTCSMSIRRDTRSGVSRVPPFAMYALNLIVIKSLALYVHVFRLWEETGENPCKLHAARADWLN